jgi:hypothetical protein
MEPASAEWRSDRRNAYVELGLSKNGSPGHNRGAWFHEARRAAMLQGRFFRRLVELRTGCAKAPELPFAKVLTADSIQAIVTELKVEFRDRIYSPLVTLWVFLSQVLDADHSCR